MNGLGHGAAGRQDQGATRAICPDRFDRAHPIWKLTVSGEVWHFAQPLTHGDAVGNLWASSYSVRKNLVIDAGFDHGFTGTSTPAGKALQVLTYLLPPSALASNLSGTLHGL